MKKHFGVWTLFGFASCVTALWGSLASSPVLAQSAAARASASVDLDARFAQAKSNPDLADTLQKIGRKAASVCANCHGEAGNSSKPDVPNLAGQNPAYLLEQLRQFADGRRRNTFMEGMIKAMTSDEKVGTVLFYAAQTVAHTPAASADLAAKGQAYYGKVCFRCHGLDGHGNEQLARIAGQQAAYLEATLKRYRAGSGVRINPLMADNTRLMTDGEIEAVVAYVHAMP